MSGIKVAVIGCGAQGRNHLTGYRKLDDVEIAAICDTDPERLRQAAADFEVSRTYSTYEALLEADRYDIVSVCTMPVSHKAMAIDAFSRGANVICEKPMALNLAEAEAMAAAGRAAGKYLTLGFNMRFMPAARYLRAFVERGDLGQILCSRAWTMATDIPWWGKHYVKRISGGGVLASTAVHILDLATWVQGGPRPVAVSGSLATVFPRKRAATAPTREAAETFDVEDTVSGHIRFADGTWMDLSGAWSWDQPEYSYSFELAGDRAAVQFAPLRVVAERDCIPVDVTPDGVSANSTGMFDWPQSIYDEIADCVAAVRENRSPLIKVEEALAVQATVDALYLSAELGREVPIRVPV
jgi:predicted dehydrogenase